MKENNLTIKDIIGHEIGDDIWFVSSIGEPMKLNIQYIKNTIEGTNTTYRFISIPTKGRIVSLYVTKRQLLYSNQLGRNRFLAVGGTRISENNVADFLKQYNPKTDIITFEIETEYSPGAVARQDWQKAFEKQLIGSSTFFSYGKISVDMRYVGSSPEEAEEKYLNNHKRNKHEYIIKF